ncbi:MAG: hypothetical protein CME71_11605 [Halobacteriovorax sp.]|nr:hypothetical protein [Halobacteriovorax sp.]
MKVLILLLLISSCSTGLRVKSGTCSGIVELKKKTETAHGSGSFIYRKFGFGKQYVDLDELLAEAKAPECKRIRKVSLAIESDFFDQVVSSLPLISQWTISMKWDEIRSSDSK